MIFCVEILLFNITRRSLNFVEHNHEFINYSVLYTLKLCILSSVPLRILFSRTENTKAADYLTAKTSGKRFSRKRRNLFSHFSFATFLAITSSIVDRHPVRNQGRRNYRNGPRGPTKLQRSFRAEKKKKKKKKKRGFSRETLFDANNRRRPSRDAFP